MGKSVLPSIFVSLSGASVAALENQAGDMVSSSPGYELRLDFLQDFSDMESRLHQMFLRMHNPLTIATCRRVEAGGHFQGSVEEQVAILQSAVRAGSQWVDLEIESVDDVGPGVLKQFAPAKVICSYHNYRKTPPLGAIYRRMARLPVQVVKICWLERVVW